MLTHRATPYRENGRSLGANQTTKKRIDKYLALFKTLFDLLEILKYYNISQGNENWFNIKQIPT